MNSPTEEAVNALHARYCASLQKAFDEGKASAGYPSQQLIVH